MAMTMICQRKPTTMTSKGRSFGLLALLSFVFLFWGAGGSAGDSAQPIQKEIRIDTARNTLETARMFMKAGKYMKAIEYYDLLLEKYKDSKNDQECSWGLYEKSYCYYKLKKYVFATKGFESIKTKYPDAAGPISLAEKMLAKMDRR